MSDLPSTTQLVTEHGGRFVETFGAIATAVFTLLRGLTGKLDRIIELLTDLKSKKE